MKLKPAFLLASLILGGFALAESEPADSKSRFKIPGLNRKEKKESAAAAANPDSADKNRSLLPKLKREKEPRYGASSPTPPSTTPKPPALPAALQSVEPTVVVEAPDAPSQKKARRLKMPSLPKVPVPSLPRFGRDKEPVPPVAESTRGEGGLTVPSNMVPMPVFEEEERQWKRPSFSMPNLSIPKISLPKVPRIGRGKETAPPVEVEKATMASVAAADGLMVAPGSVPLPVQDAREEKSRLGSGFSLPKLRKGDGEASPGAGTLKVKKPGKEKPVKSLDPDRPLKLEGELAAFFSSQDPPPASMAAQNPELREAWLAPSQKVEELRRNGIVGENSFGLVDLRGSLDEADQQIISLENRNRRAIYQAVAYETGEDYQKVARLHAKVIWEGLSGGDVWAQNSKGEWTRK